MASVTLRTGHKMPLVGKGLWKVPSAEAADTVYNAIKAGYRCLDAAYDYGNETECGQGLARAIKEGIVKREEMFITSKLWPTFYAQKDVEPILKKQLAFWGLEYFDLYLMHFPISLKYVDPETRYPAGWFHDDAGKNVEIADVPIHETWAELERLQAKGLAKSIGVSNMQSSLILDLMRFAKSKPAVLQIEHHPYLSQQGLVDVCKALDIHITAYSSFGPASFVELGMDKGVDSLLKHDTIAEIAKRNNKTPAQVLLRWATQRGIAVIPKSNNPGRLRENLASTDFDLSKEDLAEIFKLDRGLRFNNPGEVTPWMSIFA